MRKVVLRQIKSLAQRHRVLKWGNPQAGYLSTGLHFPSPADNEESLEILHRRMKIRCESDSHQTVLWMQQRG